jgi:hypothetical protein
MEQIGNKEIVVGWSSGVIGERNSRRTECGGKEGNILVESLETDMETKLKNAFTASFKTANVGFIAWCVWASITIGCLALWKMTGVRWIALVGVGSLCLALADILLAFAAQTMNQVVRVIAKLKGKSKDFFREEEKECSLSKTAAECYGFMKHFFNRSQSSYDRYSMKRTHNRHVGNNARSYRSASRQATHSSGDDGSDDSGDSNSGESEPPGSSRHTARLKLSQTFSSKSNSFSYPWRFSHAFGCWFMPHRKGSAWRWSA